MNQGSAILIIPHLLCWLADNHPPPFDPRTQPTAPRPFSRQAIRTKETRFASFCRLRVRVSSSSVSFYAPSRAVLFCSIPYVITSYPFNITPNVHYILANGCCCTLLICMPQSNVGNASTTFIRSSLNHGVNGLTNLSQFFLLVLASTAIEQLSTDNCKH